MEFAGHWRRAAILGVVAVCMGHGVGWAQYAPSGELAPPGAVGTTPAPANQAAADPIVATVGGQPIHESEVEDEVRTLPGGGGEASFAQLYDVALRRVIEREALLIRARADDLATKPEILRQMQEAGDRVLENAYLQHATAARVTEATLLERYQAEVAGKPGPEEVRARAILVPTEAEANEIIARLRTGADFRGLARRFSKDVSAAKGGDLGFLPLDALNPEVGAVVFSLPPGQVSAYPVKTTVGWFVLKTEARRSTPTPTFEQARSRLLAECQREALNAVVQAALRQAPVRYFRVGAGDGGSAR
ncbi:MAG TPA: peptidylprolyl isomerase [Acetobacteraceae bacterium]|jgi:peptidyl-prolyl cis-trans isomerase C|nr:peptidylprolyl isomerase [Acetobacteraceae bacterium]